MFEFESENVDAYTESFLMECISHLSSVHQIVQHKRFPWQLLLNTTRNKGATTPFVPYSTIPYTVCATPVTVHFVDDALLIEIWNLKLEKNKTKRQQFLCEFSLSLLEVIPFVFN